MVIFEGEPHCPLAGVKVYTFVPVADVFIIEGFQEPVIGGTLLDDVGSISGF
jgi:hypothetical protein